MNTKSMTRVRACQVASALLQRMELLTQIRPTDKPELTFGLEEMEAIKVLRDSTAQLIVHGLQPRR